MFSFEESWQRELFLDSLRHRQLPISLPTIDGESLTSWIVRTSDAHGMSVQALGAWLLGRGRQLFTDDMDRGAWAQVLNSLACATGQPVCDIARTTLKIYEGALWGELPTRGRARWILPLGKSGTQRSGYGVQFCPQCLLEDDVPHLRLIWRLAFVVCCPKHRRPLHDRCRKCGAPVAVHRWRTGKLQTPDSSGITRCHGCGFDRREQWEPETVQDPVLVQQAKMINTLFSGEATVMGRQVSSLSYFAGVAIFLNVLDDERKSAAVWSALGVDGGECKDVSTSRYGSFERRPVNRRLALIHGLAAFGLETPDGPAPILLKAGCCAGDIARYGNAARTPMPYWVWKCLDDRLNRSFYVPSDGEIFNAIKYLLRTTGRTFVRVRDVCALLGMATNNSSRIADLMQSLNALHSERRTEPDSSLCKRVSSMRNAEDGLP